MLCRNPEYYGDEAIVTATDGSLVHRSSAGAGSFDSQEASQSEVLKQENPELAHGNQYAFPSSSPGYTFENAQQLNAAFNYSQTSSQMQNLATFSSAMVKILIKFLVIFGFVSVSCFVFEGQTIKPHTYFHEAKTFSDIIFEYEFIKGLLKLRRFKH